MRVAALAALALFVLALGGASHASAQPLIPATFYGSASIDGKPVPDATEVRGFIDGKDCTQASEHKGTLRDGAVSAYTISVMHESQSPGCGSEGRSVTFTIGGRAAGQTATWKSGPQRLDLNSGSGQPLLLPTSSAPTLGPTQVAATATEVAKFTPKPAGTLPTDDVSLARTPGGASAAANSPLAEGGDSGTPLLLWLLGAALLLAAVGGAVGVALSRRPASQDDKHP